MSARHDRPLGTEQEQAIFQAAVLILAETGYSGLGIEAVADRAGLCRPAVCRRWSAKLDLVIDAVIWLAAPSYAGASDAGTNAELARRLDKHYLAPGRAIGAGIVRQAISAGALWPGVDPDLIIDLMLGAATCRWLATAGAVDVDTSRRIVDIIWELIRTRAEGERHRSVR